MVSCCRTQDWTTSQMEHQKHIACIQSELQMSKHIPEPQQMLQRTLLYSTHTIRPWHLVLKIVGILLLVTNPLLLLNYTPSALILQTRMVSQDMNSSRWQLKHLNLNSWEVMLLLIEIKIIQSTVKQPTRQGQC